MYFSSTATAALFVTFTALISNIYAVCIEPPKHLKHHPIGIDKRSSIRFCKHGEKPDPPFDFKKWESSIHNLRPTGVLGHALPTEHYWTHRFVPTGTGAGRAHPTGVFWHNEFRHTGTAVSHRPRPTHTFHHKTKSTGTASTTKKSFQTKHPRAVDWSG